MQASLRLVPVGVGSAYAAPGEAQSAYLVLAGDRALCLDLGAGSLNLLQTRVAPDALEAVVITHMHPDHCADMFALRVYMAYGPGRGSRIRVLGPAALRPACAAFAGEDGWDRAFAFETLSRPAGEVDMGDGLVLRHVEVPHLEPTHALRIDWRGSSICFSADCAPNPDLPRLAAGCDVLLCEASFGDGEVPDGVRHLTAGQAGEIARRAGAGRLLLTHCYPEFDRDASLARAREAFGGPVEWARQGEEVAA